MDPFAALTDTVFHQGMELKHVQTVQSMHADRLLRIEKRQADDAALKSVWTSPFPSVLTGTLNQGAQTPYTPHSHASMTPATGPVHTPSADVFEDFDDEHCQSLLTSLHLDEDPIPRRGASRANSVRFDVSAIQGSGWGSSHASRPSNDFGPVRPNSAFGLSEVNRSHSMERSMSHKSEGRHSSTGHSVHSGRTSSLGLTNHFSIGDHEDGEGSYGMAVHAPPPGLFVLGTVPTIIRCWLNENFSHSSLLYCVVCTGSQRSTIAQDLVQELGLLGQVQTHGMGGASPAGSSPHIRLPVYLPEAVVTQPTSRPCSPGPQLPTLTVTFDVLSSSSDLSNRKAIKVFLGSDTLRAHSADLLLSQNKMALNGDDGNRLSVPFVRPEDESVFKNIVTGHVAPQKISLKGTAAPFTPAEKRNTSTPGSQSYENEPTTPGTSSRGRSPTKSVDGATADSTSTAPSTAPKTLTDPVAGAMRLAIDTKTSLPKGTLSQPSSAVEKSKSLPSKSPTSAHPDKESRDRDRDATSAGAEKIWSSWRSSAAPTPTTEDIPSSSTSGYKAPPLSSAGRSLRSITSGSGMKVLKPSRSVSGAGQGVLGNSKVGTGASYEPPTSTSLYDESRRKSGPFDSEGSASKIWDAKKAEGKKEESGKEGTGEKKKMRLISGGKTANPIGTASAFSWMKPSVKPAATSN